MKKYFVYQWDTCNISHKAEIGKNTTIHSHVSIHDNAYIGEDCQIESYVFIPNGVRIDSKSFIGPGVVFTNDPDMVAREGFKPTKTYIKSGVKIGANSTILAGVTIGENAIIGMGSVVLEDVGEGETWVGNPAKFVSAIVKYVDNPPSTKDR